MDTAVVPLPSFLLVLGLAVIFILKLHRSKHAVILPRWLYILYIFVVVAAFGMSILELARLGADHLGLGLLPMTPIGMLLVITTVAIQKNSRTFAVSIVSPRPLSLNYG
jgi:hypothetical protein